MTGATCCACVAHADGDSGRWAWAAGVSDAARPLPQRISDMTVRELRDNMFAGLITSVEATAHFCARIEQLNGQINAVVEVNPDAASIAAQCDRERAAAGTAGASSLGPLHGVCVLLKENIDTADSMLTTAGSLALLESEPVADAPLVAQLRSAGAIILGKTNLSEWANFRSTASRSGWSARGGQTHNPFVLDRSPCGSSSGSGAALAAGLATLAVGTETDGSIVCPAAVNGLIGLKPTVGVVPGQGIIPISHSQDTAGPMARTVADAAALLSVLASPQSSASADYERYLKPAEGLHGMRVGVVVPSQMGVTLPAAIEACQAALVEMERAGAILIPISNLCQSEDAADALEGRLEAGTLEGHQKLISDGEFNLLLWEFVHDIAGYLQGRRPRAGSAAPVPRTLRELLEFNTAHAEAELCLFGQVCR